MQDLIHTKVRNYRLQLLATVSALVFLNGAASAENAGSKPSVWIEIGGQYLQNANKRELFSPAFLQNPQLQQLPSPLTTENVLPWTAGGDVKVVVAPSESDWKFSASIQYGRSNGAKLDHQQTPGQKVEFHLFTLVYTLYPTHLNFLHTQAKNSESHAIVDFYAGKDVGLGLFGSHGTSVVSAGVRFAQFEARSHSEVGAGVGVFPTIIFAPKYHNFYSAENSQSSSFHGVGPSLTWEGVTRLEGQPADGELDLDWGLSAAVLFGRQKAIGTHQTSSKLYYRSAVPASEVLTSNVGPVVSHNRSRAVTVPNLGGFGGLSYKWSNAKISVGYRADVFFNAMDTGIDARKSSNVFYHGPFASISFGFGG